MLVALAVTSGLLLAAASIVTEDRVTGAVKKLLVLSAVVVVKGYRSNGDSNVLVFADVVTGIREYRFFFH
jgi:uncharacterized protein YycO